MANEVRIKVVADAKEAKKEMKQLDKQLDITKGRVGGLVPALENGFL